MIMGKSLWINLWSIIKSNVCVYALEVNGLGHNGLMLYSHTLCVVCRPKKVIAYELRMDWRANEMRLYRIYTFFMAMWRSRWYAWRTFHEFTRNSN